MAKDAVRLAVLYTSGAEPDWPDVLDAHTGAFIYFGDNRSPGRELHDTQRKGNLLLSRVFEWAHHGAAGRARVPPFLLFDKAGPGRDVRFRGLLAPGASRLSAQVGLIAVWRTTKGQRFQNYRATFKVLDVPRVSRARIIQVLDGEPLGSEPGRVASVVVSDLFRASGRDMMAALVAGERNPKVLAHLARRRKMGDEQEPATGASR